MIIGVETLNCEGKTEFLFYEDVGFITERDDTFTLTLEWYYCPLTDTAYHLPQLNEGTGVAETIQVTIMSVPVGTMLPYAGNLGSIPDKYLLCDGRQFSTAAYPDLFGAIGYAWGGSMGSFFIPRMQGRVPIGIDPTQATVAGATTRGGTGGAQSHVLTVAEMPAHAHSIAAAANSGNGNLAARSSINTPGTGLATASTGGGAAHNNMPPFVVVGYIIKALPD